MILTIKGQAFSPETVRHVYACPDMGCSRMLTSYNNGTPVTRHANGLPELVMAAISARQVFPVHCDKHGGEAFPGADQIDSLQARTLANIALRTAQHRGSRGAGF